MRPTQALRRAGDVKAAVSITGKSPRLKCMELTVSERELQTWVYGGDKYYVHYRHTCVTCPHVVEMIKLERNREKHWCFATYRGLFFLLPICTGDFIF